MGQCSWCIGEGDAVKEGAKKVSGKQSTEKTYADGEIIVKKGEPSSDKVYEIQSGKVQVIDSRGDKETVLDVFHEGDIFGEIGLMDAKPRIATAKAVGTVRVLVFDKEAFLQRLREEPPFALTVLKRLTERVSMRINELYTLIGILKDVKEHRVVLKEKVQAHIEELEKTLNKLQSGQ